MAHSQVLAEKPRKPPIDARDCPGQPDRQRQPFPSRLHQCMALLIAHWHTSSVKRRRCRDAGLEDPGLLSLAVAWRSVCRSLEPAYRARTSIQNEIRISKNSIARLDT